MEKRRDITFDIAKGIGIVLVVIGHYLPANAPGWYVAFNHFVYHFHMPLFFLIAGFFYERSTRKESYGAFVWNKFQRLMFPYFILSWAIIGVKIGLDNYLQVDHPVTLDALYRVFYLPEAGYFLWFVYVLFLIFCIVPFFKPGKRLIILSLIALGIAFWNTAPTYCCFNLVCRNLIFFVVGMWTARKVWLERLMNRHLFLWTVLTISLSIVYTYLPHGFFTLSLTVIMGVTGSYMVVSLSQRIARCNHKMAMIFNRLGGMSMTIYLFHTWVMGGGKAILTYISFGENILEFILSSLFIIGTGLIIPIWLYRWVWAKNKFTSRIFK